MLHPNKARHPATRSSVAKVVNELYPDIVEHKEANAQGLYELRLGSRLVTGMYSRPVNGLRVGGLVHAEPDLTLDRAPLKHPPHPAIHGPKISPLAKKSPQANSWQQYNLAFLELLPFKSRGHRR